MSFFPSRPGEDPALILKGIGLAQYVKREIIWYYREEKEFNGNPRDYWLHPVWVFDTSQREIEPIGKTFDTVA